MSLFHDVDTARPVRCCVVCERTLYMPHINCPYCGGATINTSSDAYKNRYIMHTSYDSAWLENARGNTLLTLYRTMRIGPADGTPISEQQWQRILVHIKAIVTAELDA